MNTAFKLASSVFLALTLSSLASSQIKGGTPPKFCHPCLWYSGDFDTNASNADALTDEKDLVVSSAVVYVPFEVPKGKIWTITGVFGNEFSAYGVIDPAQADWSFSTGISPGHAGKLIKSGTSPATYPFTDCNGALAIYCGPVLVTRIKVTLKAGRYWLSVVPYCTNLNDSNCEGGERFFLANSVDRPPLNHYGPPNILKKSYFTSKFFNFYYAPADDVCKCNDYDMFSVGLLGTQKDVASTY